MSRYQFQAEEDPTIRFSATKNNPLCGITFIKFIRLLYLKENQRWRLRRRICGPSNNEGAGGIDWHIYPHRIIALLFLSMFNSFLSLCEYLYMNICLYQEIQLIRAASTDNNKVQSTSHQSVYFI